MDPEEKAQSDRIKAANKAQSDRIKVVNDPQARVKRVEASIARRAGKPLSSQPAQAPDLNTAFQQLSADFALLKSLHYSDPQFQVFFAKQLSSDKQFAEWVRVNSAWVIAPTSIRRTCTDDASPAALIDPTDDDIILVMTTEDITSGVKHKAFVKIAGGGSGLQILPVSKDGGSAGDQSTRCSFTYTIRSLDLSTVLGTNVPLSSNGQRVLKATMQEGSSGLVQKENGLIRLYWVDEVFEQADCSTSDTFASP